MTFVNIFWHLLTLADTWWHLLTFSDTCWHWLTLFDTRWHLVAPVNIFWHLLTLMDICQHMTPADTGHTANDQHQLCCFGGVLLQSQNKLVWEQTTVKHLINVWTDLIQQTERFLKILTFFQYNLFKTMQAYSVSIKQFSLIYQHLSCELLCRDYIGQLLPT